MENQILELLQKMNLKLDEHSEELKAVRTELKEVKSELKEVNRKVDVIYDQTADLTEFKSETNYKLDKIITEVTDMEKATITNCYEIAKLKAVR